MTARWIRTQSVIYRFDSCETFAVIYSSMKTSVTDCVIVRSRDKDSKTASTSSFRVTFQRPLQGTYMLVYALVPASVYPVSSANNVIFFRENSLDKSATLTPGNYSAT